MRVGGYGMTKASFTLHGGNLSDARTVFGEGDQSWLDLSTGINPVSWPGTSRINCDWQALPEPQLLAILEAAAARHFGVTPDLCCAVPGSDLALRLLGKALDVPAAFLAPGYSGHSAVWSDSQPVADFDALPDEALALLLANPNNPDGCIYTPERLLRWHDSPAGENRWLVVDEAFADATPDISLAAHIAPHRRLIILRSFGKFFGLAGLRLGFVLAPPEIIAGFRRMLGDWPLSSAALAIGTAAYEDSDWILKTRNDLEVRANRLDALLESHGLSTIGACPHFRLIENDNAEEIFRLLARKAILTRPFDYEPRWLRLGVPASNVDFARLREALADG